MKNTMKIILVVLTSFALNSIAVAGALSVSGGATARYQILSGNSASASNNLDKGIGLTNEFSLSASGELDNGMSWAYALDLDPSGSDVIYDDAKLTLTSDSLGTFGLFIHEGSLGTKYGGDTSAYGVATDTGDGGGMIYAGNISSYDNFQYHLPSGILPLGGSFKVAYSPTGQAQYSSGGTATLNTGSAAYDVTQTQVKFAPIDGLDIGADYQEVTANAADQKGEEGSYYIKYTMGAVSVGYGKSYKAAVINSLTDGYTAAKDTALSGYESIENKSMGIGFAVNDDFSVSYTKEESTPNAMTAATTTYEMEVTSIQASYTMGGMTFFVSQDSMDNTDYVQNQDETETLVGMTISF